MDTWHGTYSGYTNHGCRCAACREAKRQAAAAYRKANKDKVNAYKRESYVENKERVQERNRAWRDANAEKVRAYERVRYVRDRDKRRAVAKANYQANRAKYLERAKEQAVRDPEAKKRSSRKRRKEDPELFRAKDRARARADRERDPEPIRRRFRHWARSPEGVAYFRWQRQTRKDAVTDEWTKPWIAILATDPCCYCGGPGGHIEHIDSGVPRDSRWSNLTSACGPCNASKRSSRLLLWLYRRKEAA